MHEYLRFAEAICNIVRLMLIATGEVVPVENGHTANELSWQPKEVESTRASNMFRIKKHCYDNQTSQWEWM